MVLIKSASACNIPAFMRVTVHRLELFQVAIKTPIKIVVDGVFFYFYYYYFFDMVDDSHEMSSPSYSKNTGDSH